VLADCTRLIGTEHVETLTTRDYLLCNVLGEFHVETMRCRGEIVRTMRLGGQFDEAEAAALVLLRDEEKAGICQSIENVSVRAEPDLLRQERERSPDKAR
jgi:hypothetical protein